MSPTQEETLLKIARCVAGRSRLTDKEEAFSIALLGIAKGLSTYTKEKQVKLTTYLYSCAKFECWAEWRKQHRIKRGGGMQEVSLEELMEEGFEI